MHVFSRRELYDLVWSKSMQKVAAELGISDRGLAKICDRHRVPSPPRGYWARLAAGQKVKRALYREVDDPSLSCVRITAGTSNLPEETREILSKAREARVERRAKSEPVVAVPAAAAPSIADEKLHSAIAPTGRTLRKAKASEIGGISATGDGMCGVVVDAERAERSIAFLDVLATTLEAAGLLLRPTGAGMSIVVGQDQVAFTLTERTRRDRHSPTLEEQTLHERRQAKRHSAAARKDWDLYMSLPYERPWPEYDTIYTGKLAFQIEGWLPGLRKTWADGKTQTVESMFDDIVAGLQAVLASKKADRLRREEEARREAELARRRRLARKRHEREEQRIAHLRELVQLQREATEIRSWLESLPNGTKAVSTTELGRMLIWARERLVNLELQTTGKAASVQMDGMALFPEVDELHDPLGDPPEPERNW